MEFSFIQFSDLLDSNQCGSLPIVQPSDLAFYLDAATLAVGITQISAVDKNGVVIQSEVDFDILSNWIKLKGTFTFDVSECFALKLFKNNITAIGDVYSLYNSNSYLANNTDRDHKIGHSLRLVKNVSSIGAVCTDIDANEYQTVTVNGITITTTNLKVTKYNDGTVIPIVTTDIAWAALTTGARCSYNNDTGVSAIHGFLYNGYCLDGTKQIAPLGWHVATYAELNSIYTYSFTHFGTSLNGAKAISSQNYWTINSPTTGHLSCAPELNNFLGTDFTPSGKRNIDGTFASLGENIEMFCLVYGSETKKYTNLLKINTTTDTSLLRYSCNEPQYGFAYDVANSYNQVRLPIRIYNPQPLQEKSVYKGSDGIVHVLSATMKKEYELETDYIPEQWHDNIVVALNHDTVTIDTVSLSNEEYDYSINWEEYTDTECGERLTKGTTKMQQNKINRNSNCE